MMRNDIKAVISAEVFKARRRRSTVIVPAVTALVSVLLFFAIDFAAGREWIGVSSGFYLTSSALGWIVNLIGLLAVIATCFQISGEFAYGTVKPAWVRPLSRESWYFGKLASVVGAVTAVFLISIAVIVLLSSIKPGYSDLMEKNYLVHSAGEMGGRLALVSLLTLWALWAVIVVTSLVASVFNRPGGAIATVIVISLMMTILTMFPAVKPILLTTSLTEPFEQMTFMSKGLPLPYEWGTLVRRSAACSSLWLAGTMIPALYI
ncbi:MAG TPA: ABC transporter permease, partial [Candidatus Krumholzibacterium sp.]|nr:ABC transporter permease [Candidatus Krumholzibacterium sp.]